MVFLSNRGRIRLSSCESGIHVTPLIGPVLMRLGGPGLLGDQLRMTSGIFAPTEAINEERSILWHRPCDFCRD